MFNATYFIYDGQSSELFGLKIVDFNDGVVNESVALSPTLSTQKAPGLVRFYYSGIEYDSAPTCEFCVLSEQEFDVTSKRTVLSWLLGRKQFKQLKFIGGDNDDLAYYCVFTSVKNIYVGGRCHGFRLTATFDSPYARGAAVIKTISGSQSITINNPSDIIDDYTYPIVSFTGGDISIINNTDNGTRVFGFAGLSSGVSITVNNETRCITCSSGEEVLSHFTKNWLRLRPGVNSLSVTSSGTVTITCPHYTLIGY